ncbi:hypothetical protein SteCoe_10714 [Stentor coeruleus]|uniref:Uncharacterized protein n=1 Tax=Stentor coeruleus TaxID=5963 RepID=A0A1R2CEV1_9CILI|nr:hypothetical protein SteCoe_10714 [Stentor coeruleus]
MFKRPEKDIIYDANTISTFNCNTKKNKKTSYTWNQDLYTLQSPGIPREANNAIVSIYGSLSKLGNPVKLLTNELTTIETPIQTKAEIPFSQKTSTKDEIMRNPGEKLRELDIKVIKKSEENKRMLESTSLLSMQTKNKIEELEIKVAKLKNELEGPKTRRTLLKSELNTKSAKVILPRLYKK